MIYLLLFLSSLITVIISTPYLIEFLQKNNLVDVPDARKVHKKLTPRMGGILIHLVVTFVIMSFHPDLNAVRFLVIASFIVVSCGLLDDGFGLKWSTKFLIQMIAVSFLIYHYWGNLQNVYLLGMRLPQPVNIIIVFFFALGIINALNMMDGLDGLVSGFSFSVFALNFAFGFLFHNTFLMLLSVSLAGALLGFIKFNAYPSKIFLGDSGSLTLGFFLVVSCFEVSISKNGGNLDLTLPIITLALPVLDTLRVMGTRVLAGNSPFLPDKNHLHHIILSYNIRHKTVVFAIQSFAIIYLFSAISYFDNNYAAAYVLFVVNSALIIAVRPLLNFVLVFNRIQPAIRMIVEFPATIIKLFDKYIFFISSIAFLMIYLTSTYGPAPNSLGIISFLLLFEVALLLVSIYHNRVNYSLNHFYVFLNFLVFFSLSQVYSYSAMGGVKHIRYLFETKLLYDISIILIAAFVIMFLASRNHLWSKTVMFFSGVDLFILVITGFSFVLRNYFAGSWVVNMSNSLLLAFICFTWVKILMLYYKRLSYVFFYGTFALSILALVIMIVK